MYQLELRAYQMGILKIKPVKIVVQDIKFS